MHTITGQESLFRCYCSGVYVNINLNDQDSGVTVSYCDFRWIIGVAVAVAAVVWLVSLHHTCFTARNPGVNPFVRFC